jgi:gluconokinase
VSAPVRHIVVMGVSGCGKSTTGAALAARLGWDLIEGDSFHPPANVAKMKAGHPLNDEDRRPWLEALAAELAAREAAGRHAVLCCSALRRSYREILRKGAPGVWFVHVHGPRELLAERLGAREGHFFPPALLQSQLDTLEPLGPDEDGIVIDLALPVARQVDEILRRLDLPAA